MGTQITPLSDAQSEIIDIDEAVAAVQAEALLSAERHGELMERLNECQNRMDQLSSRLEAASSSQAESPLLSQILTQLTEMRAEVETLKSGLEKMREPSIQTPPSESTPPQEPPVEPVQEESTVEPERERPAATPKPKKFRLL